MCNEIMTNVFPLSYNQRICFFFVFSYYSSTEDCAAACQCLRSVAEFEYAVNHQTQGTQKNIRGCIARMKFRGRGIRRPTLCISKWQKITAKRRKTSFTKNIKNEFAESKVDVRFRPTVDM